MFNWYGRLADTNRMKEDIRFQCAAKFKMHLFQDPAFWRPDPFDKRQVYCHQILCKHGVEGSYAKPKR